MRPSVVAGLLLPILGCSQESADLALRLDLPLQGTERAAIVAVASETRGLISASVSAVEDGAPFALAEPFAPEESLEVTALLYDQSLAEISVLAGVLEMSVPDEVPWKALPKAQRVVSARISNGVSDGFSEDDAPTGALSVARLPACANFDAREVPLDDAAKTRFVFGLGRGVLIGDDAGGVAYATLQHGQMRLTGPGVELFDAFISESGELWMAGARGQIFRGRLAPEGCTRDEAVPCTQLETTHVMTNPSAAELRWIDGPRTGTVSEVFTLSARGTLEHVDLEDGRVQSHDLANEGARVRGGLAWVGPREAVFAVYDNAFVGRWRDGRFNEEKFSALEIGTDSGMPSAVTWAPELGVVLGTWSGQIFVKRADAELWDNPIVRGVTDNIVAVAPYEGDLVLLDSVGRVQELAMIDSGPRFCGDYLSTLGGQDDPVDLTVVGRDLVVAVNVPDEGRERYLRWLVRRK